MDGGFTAAFLLSPPHHLRTADFLSKRWGPPHAEAERFCVADLAVVSNGDVDTGEFLAVDHALDDGVNPFEALGIEACFLRIGFREAFGVEQGRGANDEDGDGA
jgi:hypothetical protein